MSGLAAGWTEAVCSLCGGLEREALFREGAVGVFRCSGCGLTYVSPRRTPAALLEQVYDASYWSSPSASQRGYGDYAGEEPLWRRSFERRLARIEPLLGARGRALDVGCASGVFLELLAQRGWEVHGIEPSAAMCARARARLGPERVLHGRLEEQSLAPAGYELITLWDVLEHLSEPVAALRQLGSALAPGGRLVLLTQDVASLVARLLGRRWHHYKHDEHLQHFQAETLERALRAAGLRSTARLRRDMGKWVSWSFVVERAGRLSPALARLLARCARFAPTALYLNPYDELLAVARHEREEAGHA